MYMCSLKHTHHNSYCSSILHSQISETTQRSVQDRPENKLLHFHPTRYKSVVKTDQITTASPASTNKTLSQVQKNICCLIPFA